ncbi:GNAT family N-acetyltransferase [Cobetia sp. ICG0124]|uniref:GNAT family N-acetyltransferase n=1 Tax=Cobetia sp. ICG0124 TaxID=2053669 RepID=UPI000FD7E1E2|nr:GNAT family N-acetyltransferase [Cobetia sp. ICG0124]AZV32295.1 GNAT family N-acetyltransferase [Cobetia sp. ICG0124]
MRSLAMAKAATQLGGEQALVVFDAAHPQSGLDPDAFGAVAGTLMAGGLLVLVTPAAWADAEPAPAPDGDYARLAHWPFAREQLAARYLARLARRLQADASVLHWPQGEPLPTLPPAGEAATRVGEVTDPDCLTSDQAEVVAALAALRPNQPVVISADRGRGKSAALGIAAARCLAAGESVWLTAPRPAAVAAVFARLAALLPRGRREGNAFRLCVPAVHPAQARRTADGAEVASELRFLAPDAIAAARLACPEGPLPRLFVDEAAAIPTPLLKASLAHFPRIAFATTVHGYEGTGRGFQLRFRQHLERQCPGWQALEMTTPVRWASGDPLEALIDDLLLLSAPPSTLAPVMEDRSDVEQWLAGSEVVVLDRDALARDEAMLESLFGLLVQAHYRTTPADLRQLLDTPGLRLLAIRHQETASGKPAWLGVVAAVEEGGFPAPLAEDIWRGQRRPRGHLLAQSLAAHAGHQAAAETRWWRILRIAIHPALWRRGQGARLLNALEQQARLAGVTRLGTSFGAEAGLVDFWLSQGFMPLRMGLKRDAASGEHAVMMGKATGEDWMRPRVTDSHWPWPARMHQPSSTGPSVRASWGARRVIAGVVRRQGVSSRRTVPCLPAIIDQRPGMPIGPGMSGIGEQPLSISRPAVAERTDNSRSRRGMRAPVHPCIFAVTDRQAPTTTSHGRGRFRMLGDDKNRKLRHE